MPQHLRFYTAMIVLGVFALMGCKSQPIEINIKYENLAGLAKQDRVLLNQNQAGVVSDIQYLEDQTYVVRIAVDKGFAHALTEYSKFYVIDDPAVAARKAIDIRISQQGGVPLKSGATVPGTTALNALTEQLQDDIETGVKFFKDALDAITQDVQNLHESDAYRQIKKSLQALAQEIKDKEAQARENIKREWLPKIQRKLDELRDRLKELGREEELKPLEVEMERIRLI